MPKSITFEEWEEKQLQDPEFCAAAAELEPGHQVARLRIKQGLTQEQLAARVNTTQSAIARLESGKRTPSLANLRRIFGAMGYSCTITLQPLGEHNTETA